MTRRTAACNVLGAALAALGLACLWLVYLSAVDAARAVTEAQALACARSSDGTDASIADCYTVRGLPVPGDL